VTGRTRVALAVGALVLAAVTFIAVRPSGDSSSTVPTTATTTAGAAPHVIRIRGGKPVGGVHDITVKQGGRIRFTVLADAPEHVHLHGYDVEKPVGPQQPARYDLPATINGVFVIELEDAREQIGQLTVDP